MIPPVIVIGMHRSGTSLVARLLGELGLFIGKRLDDNNEALFFSRHNTWLLNSCGGRWDTPRCIEYLYSDPQGQELAGEYLSLRLKSPVCLEYLGISRFMKYRSILNITEPWGWKDPRTTLTLPLWLKIFPEAKIIHIIRNGIDVAASLSKRQQEGFLLAKKNFEEHRALAGMVGKKGWFGTSPRVLNIEEGIRLWEEYLEYAGRFTSRINDRIIEIRYEDFLAEPEEKLMQLATFSGLKKEILDIRKTCSEIHQARAFSFAKDEKLMNIWNGIKNSRWFVKYGYNKL